MLVDRLADATRQGDEFADGVERDCLKAEESEQRTELEIETRRRQKELAAFRSNAKSRSRNSYRRRLLLMLARNSGRGFELEGQACELQGRDRLAEEDDRDTRRQGGRTLGMD